MITLRPHHLIDIIRNIGQQRPVVPHPYGHAQHLVTQQLLDNKHMQVLLKVGADDICAPCIHLRSDEKCDDVLPQLNYPIMKQNYNDELDDRILDFLQITEGTIITFSEFVDLIEINLKVLVPICTHPSESISSRRDALIKGITFLRKTVQGSND